MAGLKRLPVKDWPAEDRRLFEAAYQPGDIFDEEAGRGQHLAFGSRRTIEGAWGRWLGFLAAHHPDDLLRAPAERITAQRVRAHVDDLRVSMLPASVGAMVAGLCHGARLVAPGTDWSWLRAIASRLQARSQSRDRFEHLVAPRETLDFGFALMDEALAMPATARLEREIHFRDGLIIAILSYWPIRRRSLAALTVDRHVSMHQDHMEIRLFPEDTKAKRAEEWAVPTLLAPYLDRYLRDIRPRLAGKRNHNALWVGQHGTALTDSAIYDAVGRRIEVRFGRRMCLHDFRRAAATFLATQAPEKVGLIPGILQHVNPDTGDYYNLSRTAEASRRHSAAISGLRAELRSLAGRHQRMDATAAADLEQASNFLEGEEGEIGGCGALK